MTADNIARVFGPSLVECTSPEITNNVQAIMEANDHSISLVKVMLENEFSEMIKNT